MDLANEALSKRDDVTQGINLICQNMTIVTIKLKYTAVKQVNNFQVCKTSKE